MSSKPFLAFTLLLGFALSSSASGALLPRTPLQKVSVDIVSKSEQPYHVSVKFIDAAKIRASAGGTVVSSLTGHSVSELQNFLSSHQLTLTPEIALSSDDIAQIQKRASIASNAEQPDLAGMFRVAFATTSASEQQSISEALQALLVVEYVQASSSLPDPPQDIPPLTLLYESQQTYFAPGPGLDIAYAAGLGLTGSTMQYVDIEYCWFPDHEDLGDLIPEPIVMPSQTTQTPVVTGRPPPAR